jgi:hypothetical protein
MATVDGPSTMNRRGQGRKSSPRARLVRAVADGATRHRSHLRVPNLTNLLVRRPALFSRLIAALLKVGHVGAESRETRPLPHLRRCTIPVLSAKLLSMSSPFWGSGVKTADTTMMSHSSGRGHALMKSRVSRFCEPESWIGGSLESQPRGATVRGRARPTARGFSREASSDKPRGRRIASRSG